MSVIWLLYNLLKKGKQTNSELKLEFAPCWTDTNRMDQYQMCMHAIQFLLKLPPILIAANQASDNNSTCSSTFPPHHLKRRANSSDRRWSFKHCGPKPYWTLKVNISTLNWAWDPNGRQGSHRGRGWQNQIAEPPLIHTNQIRPQKVPVMLTRWLQHKRALYSLINSYNESGILSMLVHEFGLCRWGHVIGSASINCVECLLHLQPHNNNT